jgi:23S rRNA pseudouridine2604 synthase
MKHNKHSDDNAINDDEPIRLSKLMSQRNLCSRREADVWIEKGWVKVNGEIVAQLGSKVSPDAKIEISPSAKKQQAELAYIILNKPVGYVSSQPEPGYTPAIKLITPENQFTSDRDTDLKHEPQRLKRSHFDGLAVVGRLDIDSQGLLLFTQDGRLAKKIIGQDSDIEKEYLVRYSGRITEEKLGLLRFGLSLDDKPLKPAQIEILNADQLKFILIEGRKRQIRRMMELVDLRVTGLKRVRVGQLKLKNLPEGQWRFLSYDEVIF